MLGQNAEIPPLASPPDAPSPPLVQEAEPPPPPEPTPAPDAPRVPPVPPAEMTPPPPPPPAPDPLSPPPVEAAETAPSTPPPDPIAAPSTPPQVVQARPLWARARDWQAAASRTNQANNGAAWMGRLEQWRARHAVDPRDASQTDAGGDVKIRLTISAEGEVTSIQLVQGSGSSVLDAAALAVFRNARLPPLPPGSPAQPADVVMTLRYRPSGADG